MQYAVRPYAVVSGTYITRFIDALEDMQDGEVAIPVVQDPDPPLAADERLWGPEYEVLGDHVRAYCLPVKADPSELVRLTFAQLLIGLVAEGWISEADGEGWLGGTLPGPVIALIGSLPAEQQFPAKARALRPSEVLRNDPMVVMLGALQGKTPAELDAFFVKYSQV